MQLTSPIDITDCHPHQPSNADRNLHHSHSAQQGPRTGINGNVVGKDLRGRLLNEREASPGGLHWKTPLRCHSHETTLCLSYLMMDKAHHSAVIADGVSRSKGHLQH